MAHEILKLKPVTNTGLNIDGPVYSVGFPYSFLLFLLSTPAVRKGERKGNSCLDKIENATLVWAILHNPISYWGSINNHTQPIGRKRGNDFS